jgi:hypothetical protein
MTVDRLRALARPNADVTIADVAIDDTEDGSKITRSIRSLH